MKRNRIALLLLLSLLWCGPKKEKSEKKRGVPPPASQPGKIPLALSVKNKKVILTGKERAVVKTNKGTFVIQFYEKDAPKTVKNFIRNLMKFFTVLGASFS